MATQKNPSSQRTVKMSPAKERAMKIAALIAQKRQEKENPATSSTFNFELEPERTFQKKNISTTAQVENYMDEPEYSPAFLASMSKSSGQSGSTGTRVCVEEEVRENYLDALPSEVLKAWDNTRKSGRRTTKVPLGMENVHLLNMKQEIAREFAEFLD